MNILIVEDDPNLRALWEAVFGRDGHVCRSFSDAAAAREALMGEPQDLVILDLYLGRDNGLSVATLATYANPECKVIVVTGSSQFTREELYQMAPSIVSVLRKPVDIETLIDVADQVARGLCPSLPVAAQAHTAKHA